MTRRAVAIGLLCALLLAVATPFSDLVLRGTWVGLTAFPVSALFVLLVAVALNIVPRRLGIGLSSAELIVIYAMSLVAAGIPSFGLTGLLIPYIAGPFYFASPENKWEQTLWENWPQWLHPAPGPTITGLYEGLRPGTPIPLRDWIGPLAIWSLMILAVYLCFFCLASMLRKRWVDDEKLVFPLVQLPIQLAHYEDTRDLVPAILRDRIMWLFFLLPFSVHALNGLHFYFPAIPSVNVHRIPLDAYIKERPWNALSPLWLRFLFSIIGLAYLLPSELSFSLWFFYFFFLTQQVIGNVAGYPMPSVQAYGTRRFVAHQMIGGIIEFFVLGMLAARPRLQEIWNAAWGKPRAEDDRQEAIPYGQAFWGFWVGMALIALWGSTAGAGFGPTLLLFALYFVVHVVAVRLVCEGGMLYVQHPFRPLNIFLAAVGTRPIGPQRLAILSLFDHLWMVDNRSPLMPGVMQSLRLADDAGVSRRSLVGALVGAVLLSMVVSYVTYLTIMYVNGGTKLNTWFTTYYTKNLYCTWTNYLIATGEPATPVAFVTMGVGAVSMWALTFLHRTYLWWPLHPIGYLMGASWPMINFWFPIFLGWLIKTSVLRFGGHKAYQKLRPGFLGLLFGEFSAAGLWVLIDLCAGARGHEIFSF